MKIKTVFFRLLWLFKAGNNIISFNKITWFFTKNCKLSVSKKLWSSPGPVNFFRRSLTPTLFFIFAIFGQILVFCDVIIESNFFINILELVFCKSSNYIFLTLDLLMTSELPVDLSNWGVNDYLAEEVSTDVGEVLEKKKNYINCGKFFLKVFICCAFFIICYVVLFFLVCLYLYFVLPLIIPKQQLSFLDVLPFLGEALSHLLWIDHWFFTFAGFEAFIQLDSAFWETYVLVSKIVL